ncbi:septal ring lytic transglycosylase RlpA family protein [Bartonella melophagi]|uniref:Endolytic peptidoglycan transglycosylase RlpA n=1 Tax=Bartonella melophagi K-2C TaxID=1094557 RepID=J0R3K9_9HYPH|nr:septal ring lytic transglycosylase RlpA family protein [Bartonella melophagi]EJF90209.1 rare lipoprotein A [Bartonella melophagi K-2C]
MLLNSKRKLTSVVEIIFQFVPMIAAVGLLTACANQTTQFAGKSPTNTTSKVKAAKAVTVPEKILNTQHKSKNKGSRAVVGKPYQVKGKWYYPEDDPTYKRVGQASWYGSDFHGRLTANGEIYDMNLLTAAHPTMPLPSYARVTNLENGSSIIVRVNDRGPYIKDRIIDLSKQAATILGYVNKGVTNVKVEYVSKAPVNDYDRAYLIASYTSRDYNSSMMLALANTLEDKEDNIFFAFNTGQQKQLMKATMNSKQSIETFLIKLPDIGPVLINKPTSLDQITFAHKLNKENLG